MFFSFSRGLVFILKMNIDSYLDFALEHLIMSCEGDHVDPSIRQSQFVFSFSRPSFKNFQMLQSKTP